MKTLTAQTAVSGWETIYAKCDVRDMVRDRVWDDLTAKLREVLEDGKPHTLQVVADARRWSNDPLDLRYADEIHRLRCYIDLPADTTLSIEELPVPDSALVEKVVRRQIDPRGKVIQGVEGLW